MHEIPVGPVHAGIIEPGHFRFSVVGEKVLRLEERLGYTHKGIEKRFDRAAARSRRTGSPGASRGDSTVAYAWAYCMALESARRRARPAARAAGCARCCSSASASPTTSATSARSATTPALAFGLAQFSRLREDWLRASNASVFGHRYLMDCIVPGGVARRPRRRRRCDAAARGSAMRIEREVRALRDDLRRARRPAGPLHRHRPRHAASSRRSSA